MKVKAIKNGFFGDGKKRPGDVFEIENEQQFSKYWMKKVDESLPIGKNVAPEVEPEPESPKKSVLSKFKKEKKAPQSDDEGVI